MQSGQVSRTARGVAAARATFERLPWPEGDPEADDRLASDVAQGVEVDREAPMTRYLAARTRFFDTVLTRALTAGTRQVVIAGAGYDGRALRYATEGVRWFEVDHRDTQRDKLARLTRLGITASTTAYVPADFTTDGVADALGAAGLDDGVRSVVLVEGVAVYLTLPVLGRLLTELAEVCPGGSLLAVSLSIDGGSAEREARRAAFRRQVAALGEPVRSHLDPAAADRLLRDAGWQSRAGTSRGRAAGLVVADRSA